MNTKTNWNKDGLNKKYENIIRKYNFEDIILSSNVNNINVIIKKSIAEFMKTHNRVAIYGNGVHTSMLMVDFVFELKNIEYIIDNYNWLNDIDSNGYTIIREDEIDDYEIDGIILSSYYWRSEFKNSLQLNHVNIDYLDIYTKLEEKNIFLESSYYEINHPYSRYKVINKLQNNLSTKEDYWELLKRYLQIKDFQSAKKNALKFYDIYPTKVLKEFINDIEEIIITIQETISKISERNVLLLCVDTLGREGLLGGNMSKVLDICKKRGYSFSNAYSYSTSTYESLVPVYSENTDMKTEYYTLSEVIEADCRFIQEAKFQGRNIYYYTDGFDYIKCEAAISRENCHSVSEKIWAFILDASKENNSFFYLHILYESHHPYPNPYFKEPIIGHGGSAVFDFFPNNGGKIRGDYVSQLNTSLQYLDDQLSGFLDNLKCRVLLYSDHGVFIVGKDTTLMQMPSTLLGANEERIRIPIVLFSPEMKTGTDTNLVSLMELNNMVISLLQEKTYQCPRDEFIKIGRSEIYSPNYKYICKQRGADLEALAFEGFIFKSGYKLIVYDNKKTKLYNLEDEEIEDSALKDNLYNKIKEHITLF